MQSIRDRWAVLLNQYKTPLKIAALVALSMMLAICARVGDKQALHLKTVSLIPKNSTEFQSYYPYLMPTTLDREKDMPETKMIDLTAVDGDLLLTEGGAYCLSGQLKGSIRINAPEENVHLFLNKAEITAVYGPAICCESADKLVITLLPNTINSISDSGHYPADSEEEACIYSVCDVSLNGEGNLNVNALYKDAIRSKDVLKILDGEYNIRCKRTAFHGSDGLYAENGLFYISSEKYGLKTTKKGSDGRGNLIVAGGEWNILAGRYAFITTMADLVIYHCNVQQKSVVSAYDAGGRVLIEQGCGL